MRSVDYMARILKKYPTFIWLSDKRLEQEEIDLCYQIGIEFFHATSQRAVNKFLSSELLEDIFLLTDIHSLPGVVENFRTRPEIKKIFVYIRNYKEEVQALKAEEIKMIVMDLRDLFYAI